MARNSKMTSKKSKVLSILMCIVLFVALAALLIWNKKNEIEASKQIEKIAQEQNSRALEEAEELNSKVKAQVSPEAEEDEEENKSDDTSSEENQPADEEPVPETKVEGVVCWGDDLINGDASATYSYMAVLQKLLTENGYNLPVINKTLQGGGTLSMMKMAGVDDAVLQGYITSHQEKAAGASLNITETGIRDLTEEQITRNDLNCVPVIFMGYYGGWNHDPNELAEQQRNILNTFPNQEKFIVVGTGTLDGVVNSQAMDAALSPIWGEHYVSLVSATTSPAASYDGQAAMAQAVFNKLVELNYITK